MFNTKLPEYIGKPKELWTFLKTLGLASIKSPFTNICLKRKDNVTNFDDKKNANVFKNIFLHTSWRFSNLPPPSLKFGLPSVRQATKKF